MELKKRKSRAQLAEERLAREQPIFDKVADHMLTQGMKSVDVHGKCVYRSDTGRSCAIGCLIPDELYDKSFEGQAVMHERLQKVIKKAGFKRINSLLVSLQGVHDDFDASRWAKVLHTCADEFQLSHDVIDKHDGYPTKS